MRLSSILCSIRLEDTKILHGAFLPGGKSRGFAQVSKSTLPDAIRAIHKTLVEDWEDAKFEVISMFFPTMTVLWETLRLNNCILNFVSQHRSLT